MPFKELSLIDCSLDNLEGVSVHSDVEFINVHCNNLKDLSCFVSFSNLSFLDVSSNSISILTGLSSLLNLKVLNLACNRLVKVDGVQHLRKLKTLNLSYNQISDLSPFKNFKSSTHLLQHLDIYGNQISSLEHLKDCLKSCITLKLLQLTHQGDTNPVCQVVDYSKDLFSELQFLQCIDGRNRKDESINESDLRLPFLPGFQSLAELVPASESTTSVEGSLILTPKLDKIIEYRKHHLKTKSQGTSEYCSSSSVGIGRTGTNQNKPDIPNEVAERLLNLETQISTLLNVYSSKQCDPESKTAIDLSLDVIPVHDVVWSTSSSDHEVRIKPKGVHVTQISKQKVKKQKGSASQKVDKQQTEFRHVSSTKENETQMMLMQEIEVERTRRWKAEQAARRLADHSKEIQEKLNEERQNQEALLAANLKLKQALTIEKETRETIEKRESNLKLECQKLEDDLEKSQQFIEEYKQNMSTFEMKSISMEKEHLQRSSQYMKQLHSIQMRSSSANKELELLRISEKQLKDQLQQMQSLLSTREQEHQEHMKGMVSKNSREFQESVEISLAKQEGIFHSSKEELNSRLEKQKLDYIALEDEFREALHIEANRYNKLQEEYGKVFLERNSMYQSLESSSTKKTKESTLVIELTSMVKEQKVRLEELSKSKHEICSQQKERIESLEVECIQLRKQCLKLETLEQDKAKLSSHICAQDSVIDGLRSERKLWGMELAKQGSSLALDRGRLESMVEKLTSEVSHLKSDIKDKTESVAIKSKLIEDQTDTIKGLKNKLTVCSNDLQVIDNDYEQKLKTIENELMSQKEENESLQAAIHDSNEQRRGLKTEVKSYKAELERDNEEIRTLKKKWRERSDLMDQLEKKVVMMKKNFDNKQDKLMEERDSALKEANLKGGEIKSLQDTYSNQMNSQQKAFHLELRKIISSKDDEIARHKEQVTKVEEEMREILAESQQSKQILNNKIKRLTSTFKELQQDLDV